MPKNVLVIDVGSTRLKAAIYAGDGSEVHAYNTHSPLQGSRVAPDDVFEAVVLAAESLCGDFRPDAIAVTGATRSNVLTARNGQALGDLIKLDDARGACHEAVIQAAYKTPQARAMGAFHPLARLLDCKINQPDLYETAQWQLELKDWINLQLTGVIATDDITHARLAPRHTGLNEVIQQLGLRQDMQPTPMSPATVIGHLRPALGTRMSAWGDVPVVQCGFDAWCASYGMGCVEDQHVYNVSGTTEVFGSFSTTDKQLAGISALQWTPELHHLGGPCMTGLSTLAWFGKTFLQDSNPQCVLDFAALSQDDTPLCLPFVTGERMPFWRADISAQFLNVRSHHGLPEFARALIDGLMAFQRYLVTLMCPTARTVHLSGGATALQGWVKLKASMFAMPVAHCKIAEPSLLGGAMSALVAIGVHDSMSAAQTALDPGYFVIHPDIAVTRRIQITQQHLFPYFQKLGAS